MLNRTLLLSVVFLFAGSGCSSIDKAAISANAEPSQEIALLEQDFQQAGIEHVDVLAAKDYHRAERQLKEAKSDLKDGQDREEILSDVAYGRAYLERARSTADQRRPQITPLLDARAAALKAGVHSDKKLSHEMRDLDDEVEANAKDIPGKLTSKEFSELQGEYLALELKAIQNKYLATARSIVRDAKDDERAKSRTPVSLKKAENDIASAEQAIAVNRHDVPVFSGEVIKANTSAQMLREVLTAMDGNNKLDEPSAVKLVGQEHQISKLQGTMAAAESDIEDMSMRLKNQQRRLSSAQTAVGLQKAIVKAQESFDKDEAEVFQQGSDNLVIRLKKMAFSSGRAQLPQESLPLLTKVNNVITDLNAKEVSVEGHTDSTGSEQLNLTLSQKRADIVADYLRSNANGQYEVNAKGFGFARPIASNKSKEGRAQNRRVDVVIKAVPQNDSQLTEL
jgi:outer membrane protein OmpA-like peptidoglycan-associated protein